MKTTEEINSWLVAYLAKLLEVDPAQIDTSARFNEYGLDSTAAVGLSGDLGEWLDFEFKDSLAFDYPTIEGLAAYVCDQLQSTE